MSSSIAEVSAKVSQLSKWVSSFGLLLMTGIVVVQVFARYVLNDSPIWAEQAALLLMIWYVFIAAAAGVREGFHIKIVVIAEALPVRLQRWITGGRPWNDARQRYGLDRDGYIPEAAARFMRQRSEGVA